MNGSHGELMSCETLTRRNEKLTKENESLESEVRRLQAQMEKIKADFQHEIKELKYQIHSEEVKKYTESIGHLDARLKSFETRKFGSEKEKQSEYEECRLISRQKVIDIGHPGNRKRQADRTAGVTGC